MEAIKKYIPINWSIVITPHNWILIIVVMIIMILSVRLIMTDSDGASIPPPAPPNEADMSTRTNDQNTLFNELS